MVKAEKQWLSRADIDSVLDQLSADDVIESLAEDVPPVKLPMLIFNRAAARQGVSNGTPASQHIRIADMRYMTAEVGKATSLNNPKSEDTDPSQDSADTGE